MSLSPTPYPPTSPHHRRRRCFLALGVVLLILGIAGIGISTVMQVTFVLVFGPMLMASSIVQFLAAIFAEDRWERLLHLGSAGLEAILGFLVMANPIQEMIRLTVLVAVFMIVIALIRLGRSLVAQSPGRGWTVMAGLITLLLGVCVWVGSPDSRLWFVGLCISLDFLCHGASWSAIALAARKPHPQPIS